MRRRGCRSSTATNSLPPRSRPTPKNLSAVIFTEPRITVISRPAFAEPEHLPVKWLGESTDGEKLSEFSGPLDQVGTTFVR